LGSDNIFHKRKAKTAKDLLRKLKKKSPYDRVLIVSEGSKTEPNYFQDMIDCLKLNTANVEVDGKSGSSPISVVIYAKRRCADERRKGNAFDRVFCVFDKDTHTSYIPALDVIKTTRPKNVFQAINSVPCFEYWLLLHFKFTTKPFSLSGSRSSCDYLVRDLKEYLNDYSKGASGLYKKLKDKTAEAISRSKRALDQAREAGTDNPTTHIHELVEYLSKLKEISD